MGSMMAAMGASMLVWMVVGIIAFVGVVALGVSLVQRLAGDHAQPRATDRSPAPVVTHPTSTVPDRTVADTMRASDGDREYTTAVLQDNTTRGRLTADEFDDRVRTVYSSRTLGDLRALLTDLPEER